MAPPIIGIYRHPEKVPSDFDRLLRVLFRSHTKDHNLKPEFVLRRIPPLMVFHLDLPPQLRNCVWPVVNKDPVVATNWFPGVAIACTVRALVEK